MNDPLAELPAPQRATYDALRSFIDREGVSPTWVELARERGVSPRAVGEAIESLLRRRLVRRVPGKPRSLQVVPPEELLP